MGLFDFFRRKPEPPLIPLPKDEGPSADYAFAHAALRFFALAKPLQFLALMASPKADGFLDAMLDDVAEQCGRRTSFDRTAIKVHMVRAGNFPCAVIELPEPKEIAHAHMVALVGLVDTSADQPPDLDQIKGRYFTLEKGFSLSNEPRTVLGEWTDTSHLNYGDGPPVNVQAFVEAISRRVQGSK